jgi:phenylalanyl-tRNA synthetase beta chain
MIHHSSLKTREFASVKIMKISYNQLKTYIDIDESPEFIAEILTDLGLEIEGSETVGGIKGNLQGVVVGKVVECQKHPDADKLSLTKVDIGQNKLLQIVCGAPNVRAGQKVAVATIGTTLYFSNGDTVKIKSGKIRGHVSDGMICAEDELGIGTDHNGIIVLDENTPVGKPAIEVFKIEQDTVFEIGLTPNRSDATCHLGVAKDLAARLAVHHQYKKGVHLPDVSAFKVDNQSLAIPVTVEHAIGCPRYSGVSIAGVTIKDSPDWLKQFLAKIGVRSINNLVDITNFVLHELGQPLHAFDLDAIQGRAIIVKTLPDGTIFKTLDDVDRKLASEDLMICDGESNGMCIAGVFGGSKSGVKDTTKNIFLEAAHFNAKMLRRTGTRHGLHTDAKKVFEKGSDPNITVFALKRAALLIKELAGGTIASEIIDIYPTVIESKQILIRFEKIESLIGVKINKKDLKKIFKALEMPILEEDEDGYLVSVPTNKADVLREADVIEEVLRVYGFNHVPMPAGMKMTPAATENPDPYRVQQRIADALAAQGLNEMMALSLSKSKYYADNSLLNQTELVFINNTGNVDLDIMRPTMLFSALETVAHNQNRQQTDVRLFEFGKTYRQKTGGGQIETPHLSLTLTGQQQPESWLDKTNAKTDFFNLKAIVQQILVSLGIGGYQETALQNNYWAFGSKYHRGEAVLVEFGKVPAKWRRLFDVKQDVYFADFKWDTLLKSIKNTKIKFEEPSKYPAVRRDLAMVVDETVRFADMAQIARKTCKQTMKEINLFDVFEDANKLGAGKKSYAVSFIFEDKEKTLQEKEIEQMMSNLMRQYEAQLGAVVRK